MDILKILSVMRDQRHIMPDGTGGDPCVISGYRLADTLPRGDKSSIATSNFMVIGDYHEVSQRRFQFSSFLFAPVCFFRSEVHLAYSNEGDGK